MPEKLVSVMSLARILCAVWVAAQTRLIAARAMLAFENTIATPPLDMVVSLINGRWVEGECCY